MNYRSLLITTLIVLIPVTLFAADSHHEASLSGFFWRVLVFAIFAALMFILLRKRVADALSANSLRVRKEIEDAQNACEVANRELDDYSRKIAEMGKELDDMKAAARNAAEKEAETMITDAEKAALKFQQMVKRTIYAETEKAKADIRKELALKAVIEAEKLIASDPDHAKKQKFIQASIGKIGA